MVTAGSGKALAVSEIFDNDCLCGKRKCKEKGFLELLSCRARVTERPALRERECAATMQFQEGLLGVEDNMVKRIRVYGGCLGAV